MMLRVFVFGRSSLSPGPVSSRFLARQAREASEAIARLHQLNPAKTIYLQQNPVAIDAGAFHNDVVAVANENVLLYHEKAYVQDIGPKESAGLHVIKVHEEEVSLEYAVKSYLFNSQLVTLPGGGMVLIAPAECREIESTRKFIEALPTSTSPILSCHFIDVRQSMKNGGGPACLRLRVVLNEAELGAVHRRALLSNELYNELVQWVHRHYRDKLHPEDLADPRLLDEVRTALDDLSRILQLGSIYDFQRR